MCDYFLQRMESDQAGDLTDIIRAGGAMPGGAADFPSTAAEWQLPGDKLMLFPPQLSSSEGARPSEDAFEDPFAGLPDPFSSDYPSSSGAAGFFDAVPDAMDVGMDEVGFDQAVGVGGGGCGGGGGVLDMRKPILPRGIQMPAVSPLSPRAILPHRVVDGDMVKLGVPFATGQQAGTPCAIDAVAGMPMLSPRASGIKRRKNQARKVVCIPAPAAAAAAAGGGGGRTSGEVVPSDLWAWRKYGQKPIKGSPYPRGYYRCSSSKGCSARKQVERSRTDPNMLVITYTSEHNHPWPTQRNALAGSTRPHHTKNSNNNNNNNNNSASKNSPHHQKQNVKEEFNDQTTAAATATTATISSTITAGITTTSSSLMVVKDEAMVGSEMDDTSVVVDHNKIMHHVFHQSYKPMIPDGGHPDDFFADLAELESDPMSLIFSKPSGNPDHEKAIGKDLYQFSMLDWSTTTISTSAGSSFEQRERG